MTKVKHVHLNNPKFTKEVVELGFKLSLILKCVKSRLNNYTWFRKKEGGGGTWGKPCVRLKQLYTLLFLGGNPCQQLNLT